MAEMLYCCDKNNEYVMHGDATSARALRLDRSRTFNRPIRVLCVS